jgi:hypothetical protein
VTLACGRLAKGVLCADCGSVADHGSVFAGMTKDRHAGVLPWPVSSPGRGFRGKDHTKGARLGLPSDYFHFDSKNKCELECIARAGAGITNNRNTGVPLPAIQSGYSHSGITGRLIQRKQVSLAASVDK